MCVYVKSLQLCRTLCDSMDYSPSGSSVHGIPQEEYWGVLPFPAPRDLSDLEIEPKSPALAGGFFTSEPPVKPSRREYSFSVFFFL